MAGITFRMGLPEDGVAMLAVHLAAIHAIADQFYDLANRESWAFGLTAAGYGQRMASGQVFEVAQDASGRVVAFCGFTASEILGLYVHPEVQGSGLGRTMLARAEARLAKNGCFVAPLTASLNARRFYEANGWQFVEQREHQSRGGLVQPVAAMQKTIGSEG